MFAPVSRRAHRRRVSRAPKTRPSCREALCKVLDLTSSSLGRVDRLHHASRRPPVTLSMVSDKVLSMASLNLVSLAAVLFLHGTGRSFSSKHHHQKHRASSSHECCSSTRWRHVLDHVVISSGRCGTPLDWHRVPPWLSQGCHQSAATGGLCCFMLMWMDSGASHSSRRRRRLLRSQVLTFWIEEHQMIDESCSNC